ncbi:Programmed cell death protein 5, partial [Lemmus lemmus]
CKAPWQGRSSRGSGLYLCCLSAPRACAVAGVGRAEELPSGWTLGAAAAAARPPDGGCGCATWDGRAMADEELEALRKQRLAELQAKHGDPGDAAQQEAKQRYFLRSDFLISPSTAREAEMRNSILAQVLDQSARARLSNLALVKPEKTKAVENYLIQMARYGQLSGKVSEQGLIEILEKVSQQTEKKTTVKFNRRKVMDSDEDDDY